MNIIFIYQKLPLHVKTLVTENDDGSYTILINSLFNWEQQKDAVLHDLTHIARNDFTRDEHADIIEKLVHSLPNSIVNEDMEFYCQLV